MTGVVIKIVKKPFMLRWQETIFLSVLNIVGSMIVGISVELSVVQIEGGVFLLYDDYAVYAVVEEYDDDSVYAEDSVYDADSDYAEKTACSCVF